MKIPLVMRRGAARYGNLVYEVASALRRDSLREMARRYPRSFVRPPEQIATQTAFRIGPTLAHVIKEVTGRERALPEILAMIAEGQRSGYFENYGEAIFINPHRLDDLLPWLGVAPEQKAAFLAGAKKHYLLREYVYSAQAAGYFGSRFRTPARGTYIERDYSVLTRDGKSLNLTRIVNQDRVKTNDDRPSVMLVPGLACNHRFFDFNDDSSLALDQADSGRWVYLFNPRGLGNNKGEFDPQCFLDTLVSNDLPAAVDFANRRPSSGKPVVIIGHSMGGMVAEFMIIRQAYKLNNLVRRIGQLTGRPHFRGQGKSRAELETFLKETEALIGSRRALDREVKAMIAEARAHLDLLKAIKGLITLGSPKIFDKNEHPIYPLLLLLNILLPLLREEEVPVDKGKWLIKMFPRLTVVLRHLIHQENFADPQEFLRQLVTQGTDSFPLGVGLQLLKAVYSGKGVRRMDQERFNYSAHLDEIPSDLPIFHLVGDDDFLAPAFNLGFIDKSYGLPVMADFPEYTHAHRGVTRVRPQDDPQAVPVLPDQSQVHGYIIGKIGHLDFFYGQTGQRLVRPLLDRLVETIWRS